ncbi:MAG: hypothetical protein AMJ53_09505 [Gammaproteobacteria bacterium SG8_11]|nr:MAG: hypothetical protein AMJ53_09505 [Gammaproteobacteria bacterium SG8_11]
MDCNNKKSLLRFSVSSQEHCNRANKGIVKLSSIANEESHSPERLLYIFSQQKNPKLYIKPIFKHEQTFHHFDLQPRGIVLRFRRGQVRCWL